MLEVAASQINYEQLFDGMVIVAASQVNYKQLFDGIVIDYSRCCPCNVNYKQRFGAWIEAVCDLPG